jgi:hypothetical protein
VISNESKGYMYGGKKKETLRWLSNAGFTNQHQILSQKPIPGKGQPLSLEILSRV